MAGTSEMRRSMMASQDLATDRPSERWRQNRCELMATWGALLSERSSWDPHWREIGENLLPRVPRFFAGDRNRGDKRHQSIYNDAATRALRIGAAGMMAGASPRSKKWASLRTGDPALNKFWSVKKWLKDVSDLIFQRFDGANTYVHLHAQYEQLFAFGTACNVVLGDDEHTIWHYPSPIGEYAIAQDYKGRVCTLYRRFEMTVRELIDQFGIENCSEYVRGLFNQAGGSLETGIEVVNAIERRKDRDPSRRDNLNMPWRSVWFETAASAEDRVLLDSGHERFPALIPRWQVEGRDVYGSSPGMDALGGIKGLQIRERAQAKAIEFGAEPPLQLPMQMKGRRVALLPGAGTYADMMGPNGGIRPIFQPSTNLDHLQININAVEARLNESFFKNIFLMVASSSDTTQRTAAEILARQEEKTVIGPTYGRVQDELLAPLIGIAFQELLDRGELPPAPRELQGQELSIEFESVLAQAQKLVGLSGYAQALVTIDSVSKMGIPEIIDRLDADKLVDNMTGPMIDPDIIRPIEKAQVMREARARAQEAQAQSALANQISGTVKNLASAPTDQQNALQQFSSAVGQ